MEIDLEKINRLPADVKKDFLKTYLKLLDKKKETKIKMLNTSDESVVYKEMMDIINE